MSSSDKENDWVPGIAASSSFFPLFTTKGLSNDSQLSCPLCALAIPSPEVISTHISARSYNSPLSLALDVTTDAPQLPELAIVSPTPRSFTFPHNLADSPYSSPSSSPFEPDLRSLPAQHCILATSSATPPPPFAHLRSESPPRPASPASPSSHKRRKSDVERRPKKGDEDYIKRPENAFILFRRKCCEDRQAEEDAAKAEGAKKPRQADLSKTISQMWKSLPAEERQKWELMAKEKKKEHEQMYPDYVYRPQRSKDKDGKTKANKKSSLKKLDESDSLSFVVPVSRPHGRSASVPTPPPYQSIQIPNVYHMTPSCPTSPSLLPMISRRSAHPGHPEDILANFDYLPSNNYAPPSFQVRRFFFFFPGFFIILCYVQSSEFLRNIFSTNPGHRNTEQSLTIGLQDALLLPPHQIVSPSSSHGSGSSGPSSPSCGPYTPTSTLLPPNDFLMPSTGDPALDAQAQSEMDLQLQMQIQQELAAFTWEGGSVWSTEPSILLEDDFDISAIPPIELGVPKYVEGIPAIPGVDSTHGSGLDFGQEYPNIHFEGGQNALVGFEEMMAGHGF